jgi:hypothetical protein
LVGFRDPEEFTMEWSGLFDLLVGMGDGEGVCAEQKLSVYNQATK